MSDNKKNPIITQKDVMILKQLLEDGRKSSASISKEIDLGREIVNYRIKRLIKENLIVKFIPKINELALNYQEYIIFLKLNLEDELSREKFIRESIGNKYLIWVVKSQSGWDLIIRLYSQDVNEFKLKLNEILERFSDVLTDYYTIISSEEIIENEKSVLTKNLFMENKLTNDDFKVIKKGDIVQIDQKDKEIIQLLEEDGRVQYKEIAEQLDISSDTVKYRIDRMRSQGIIENFTPVINFNKLGLYQYAVILRFLYMDRDEEEKLCSFFKQKNYVIRVIKSLNFEEYFLNLAFDDEDIIDEFKKEIKNSFSKIHIFDMFKIE